MIPRKATAILFLFFSIVVAFYNYINAEYQYIIFTIPFFIAFISNGKISTISEITGIIISAVYVIVEREVYIGIMGMLVASCMFFAMGFSLKKSRIAIFVATIIVGISAYSHAYDIDKKLAISIMDAGVYFVCASCIYIAFQYHILRFVNNANEAISIAKEVIDRSNKGKGDE